MEPIRSHLMPNLSIKNVPEEIVEKLRQRAARHHRSLQGELIDLVHRYADESAQEAADVTSAADSSGWLSIDELAAELTTARPKSSRSVPLAVDIIRHERDSR